jgi:hypothetical protein
MICPTCNERHCHDNMMECWLCYFGLSTDDFDNET